MLFIEVYDNQYNINAENLCVLILFIVLFLTNMITAK